MQAKLICCFAEEYGPLLTIVEYSISLQSLFTILQTNLYHLKQYPVAVFRSI